MSSVVACLHPGGLELTDRLVAAADLPAGAAVLDVGCGVGATVARLVDGYGLRATGLDTSSSRVQSAKVARPDLDFVVGRAESLPFPDASFDAVLCECVLSTLSDPAPALGEMARVLRPGGAVMLSDLYVRTGRESPSQGGRPALGRRKAVQGLVEAAGLEMSLWQDASAALAQYLWDHAGEFRTATAPSRESRDGATAHGRRLGYFISYARHRCQ